MRLSKNFILTFMIAVSNCALYSREHAAVNTMAEKALSIFDELGEDILEIMIFENELIINKKPARDTGLHGASFMKRFKRKSVSRVAFLKGLTLSEIKEFIIDVAQADQSLGTYPHIKTGAVSVRAGGIKWDMDLDLDEYSSFTSEQVEKMKETYSGIQPFRKLSAAGLEEIVLNFVASFRKEANILQLISPVKSYSEYTYTHATNVAVLSMFQAESLGMKNELLRDIGISGLLHDVGKMFVSKDILNKKSKLEEEEWEEIRNHTVYGAKYLSKVDNLTRIAPIVAFEHHCRYDGRGYPGFAISAKKQHFCSQIVAVSDFYDALRSRRPYRENLEAKDIFALMKKDAGRNLNPFLVANFIKSMRMAQPD